MSASSHLVFNNELAYKTHEQNQRTADCLTVRPAPPHKQSPPPRSSSTVLHAVASLRTRPHWPISAGESIAITNEKHHKATTAHWSHKQQTINANNKTTDHRAHAPQQQLADASGNTTINVQGNNKAKKFKNSIKNKVCPMQGGWVALRATLMKQHMITCNRVVVCCGLSH